MAGQKKLRDLVSTTTDDARIDGVSLSALEAYWGAAAQRAGIELDDDIAAPAPAVERKKKEAPSAARLVQMLVEAGAIELEEGTSLEAFATKLSSILTEKPTGSILSAWLLDSDEVGELYLDEEQLDRLMRAW